jgi:hypothetical protein
MAQTPRSIGLALCDQVIFERLTHKPSLIGCFTGVGVAEFPSEPQRFEVFIALTDGNGPVMLDLVGIHLATEQQIYAHSMELTFPDPLKVVNVRIQVRTCVFPEEGTYVFALSANGEEVATRRVRVYLREEES